MMIYEKKDGSPMTSRIVVDKRRIKAIEKRVMQERSKSNKSKLIESKAKMSIQNPHKFIEIGQTNNQMFAAFLRFSDQFKADKKVKKKEKRWNQRFAIPFSNYNEVVFKKYKLMFDKI